ncbi:MAG TPA: hypothetical protein DDW52_25980 [Planctomycetaceae bacterium]|nr:hypothetical protein [Planctomycetaceae bacterium]
MQTENETAEAPRSHPKGGSNTRQPRVALTVVVVLAGMIGIQIAQKQFQLTLKAQPPGIGRGDMPLSDNSLPDSLVGWKKSQFTPPGEIRDGQFWWSHSWAYENDRSQALISYDQADWHGWHELSECYSASGWTLKSRKIMPDASGWSFVVSHFQKDSVHAVLLFSLFFEDGDFVAPWELSLREAIKQNMTAMDAMRDRRRHSNDRVDARSFQCQVFLPSSSKITAATEKDAIALHMASRERLYTLWLEQQTEEVDD